MVIFSFLFLMGLLSNSEAAAVQLSSCQDALRLQGDQAVPIDRLWSDYFAARQANKSGRLKAAKDKLAHYYSEFAYRLAKGLASRAPGRMSVEDIEDFSQSAFFELLDRIDSFEPSRGVPFTTYLSNSLAFRLKDFHRENDPVPRSVRASQNLLRKLEKEYQSSDDSNVMTFKEFVFAQLGEKEAERVWSDRANPGKTESLAAIESHRNAPDSTRAYEIGDSDLMNRRSVRPELRSEREAAWSQVLSLFDERDRQIVMMMFFEGMTQERVAKTLGYTGGHINLLWKNISLRLKAIFQKNPHLLREFQSLAKEPLTD